MLQRQRLEVDLDNGQNLLVAATSFGHVGKIKTLMYQNKQLKMKLISTKIAKKKKLK